METTDAHPKNPGKALFLGLTVFVLILGVFFRFYQIKEIPLGLYPDEAMNGTNAQEALATGTFKIFYPENNGREGLFINIQALSVWYFGNTPWALRGVSAVFGSLTVFGIWLLARELFLMKKKDDEKEFLTGILSLAGKKEIIPAIASFLLATSYWHINFSRIGFRAILVPFLSAFGMYFLLKGFRRGKILDFVWASIFIGLGFHTYIAFRLMPLVIALPIVWYLWKWWKTKNLESRISNELENKIQDSKSDIQDSHYCTPCAIALFLLITFVTALPIGYYFLKHPADLIGRTGQVSVFAADSPIREFAKSNVATLGMFFVRGDCNARHNLPCAPELHPIAAFFFASGIVAAFWTLWRSRGRSFPHLLLLWWAVVMTLPATLTREGLPHALRAIGMIPPVFILAGYGGYAFSRSILGILERAHAKFPDIQKQIIRISREFSFLFLLVPLFIPAATYEQYFLRWVSKPDTYFAFATDLFHIGQFLNETPNEIHKYVIVNMAGTEVRGIPMPAQTVMYTTDTFRVEGQRSRNITYLLPEALDSIPEDGNRILITPLNGSDSSLRARIKQKFPDFRESAPGDFIVYKNY